MCRPLRYVFSLGLGLCLLPTGTHAASTRATPEQMEVLRRDSAAMLDDPVANYARIPALFMYGNPGECARLRPRFEAKLAEAKTDRARAVLHFLVAEATFNEALSCRLLDREAKPPHGWRATVTDHYLAAIGLTNAEGSDAEFATHIARQFLQRIPAVVSADLDGAKLAERIVAEFINPAEAGSGTVPRGKQRVAAYKALGIAERLWDPLPATPPEEQKELDEALRMAISLGCEEKAVLYADVIWQRHDRSVKPASQRLFDATRVLLRTPGRETEMWRRLQGLDPKSGDTWLDLYRLAPKAKPDLARDERLGFLDRYLETGPVSESSARVLDRHATVIRILMVEKAYADALRYAALAVALPRASREQSYPVILFSKAECLARLGRTEEARKTYRESMKPTAVGHPSAVAGIARERLASLDAAKGEE